MTITQQVKELIQHPFLHEAVYYFNTGDSKLFEEMLFNIIFHTSDVTANNASRLYGRNWQMNSVALKPLIKEMEKPDNLDVKLPIPKERHAPTVKVFQAKKTQAKNSHIAHNQLNLFLQIAVA